MKRFFAVSRLSLMLSLSLAGCQQTGTSQSDAPVSVLPGSASDAMLPLDTVTSQPPLDPRAARGPKGEASEPAAEGTRAAQDTAEQEAAPVAGPVIKPAAGLAE